MSRNKKNVLNQNIEIEPIIEREVVEQEVHIEEISKQEEIDSQILADEFDETPEEIVPENDGSLAGLENDEQPQYFLIDNEKPLEELLPIEAPEGIIPNGTIEDKPEILKEIVKEEIKPRTIQSLGKAELRMYQRTGIMPK